MAKWTAIKSNGLYSIRRWVTVDGKRKQERLPIAKYRHFRDNPQEINQFLLRLNESSRGKVEIRHAFISPTLLDEYRDLLCTQSANQTTARCEFNRVKVYFLDFFIAKENIIDPVNWHMHQKTKWAQFLLSDKAPRSMSTKKQIIHAVNKFMAWLSEQRPTEVPKLFFQPFTKARMKELEATRTLRKEKKETHLIPEHHFKTIVANLDVKIIPFVMLAYHFGLRRSEAMALTLNHVRKGHLLVERQLLRIGIYGPTKGRLMRKIPYWSTDPLHTHRWIAEIQIMHPRTFSELWDKAIKKLMKTDKSITIEYDLKDLRHTWITRMMRANEPRDVQMAAGHVSINTTMGYLHDDRILDDDPYIPEGA